MSRKPDFLIIGGMKCGTTSLWDDLCSNDQIFATAEKEPNILIKHSEPSAILDDYRQLFKGARPDQLCGEASTWYTKRPHFEGVAARAATVLGTDVKLIMIMRDPVKRLHSHLRHHLVMDMIKPEDCDRLVFEDSRYIAFSDYAMQLQPWIDAYGLANLCCISLREFQADREGTVRRLFGFLGLDATGPIAVNSGISNEGTALRSNKNSLWRQFARSTWYKRHLRAWLPDSLRVAVRDKVLPIREVPEYHLAASTEAHIRERLEDVEARVRALIGRPIMINEPAPAARQLVDS